MEQFANNCQALVASGGYVAGSGVLNIDTAGIPWPQVGDFRVSIFDKDDGVLKVILKVTAVNSSTQFAVVADGVDANASEDDLVKGTMLTAEVMGNIPRWVEREDPSAFDFDISDLTCDNNYHDLDLSSIVPAGVKSVQLYITARSGTTASRDIFIKGKGYDSQRPAIIFEGLNKSINAQISTPCDANRIIEYKITGAMSEVSVVVIGWYLDRLN